MLRGLRLVNVKSYRDVTVHFSQGVNAIIGENGSGKTTILEAIGFVLFNSLQYSISDFVRRGERWAEIRVRILNPKDEREYEVVRRIEDGRTVEYYVIDAETGVRLEGAEGVAGVMEWIKDCFGFEIDPKTIFENAIGVPQGKITSQFLESPSVRDRIFSPLIGVEGYRKAYERSREYERYLETKLGSVEKEIVALKKDVENLRILESRLRELEEEEKRLIKELNSIEIDRVERELRRLEELKNEITELRLKRSTLSTKLEGLEEKMEEFKSELEAIANAKGTLEELRNAYERYIRGEKRLEELERKRKRLEGEMERVRKTELKLERLKAEIEELERRLEEIEECERELERIEEMARREEELLLRLRDVEIAEKRLKGLEEDIRRVEGELEELKKELKDMEREERKIEEMERQLSKIPSEVDSKRDKAMRILAKINQAIRNERDHLEKAKTGKCPILNEDCERIRSASKSIEKRIKVLDGKRREVEEKLKILDELCKKKRLLEEMLSVSKAKVEGKERIVEALRVKEELLKTLRTELGEVKEIVEKKDEILRELEGVKGAMERRIALLEKIGKKNIVKRDLESKREEFKRLSESMPEGVEEELRLIGEEMDKLRRELSSLRERYERYLETKKALEREKEIKKRLDEMGREMERIRGTFSEVEGRLKRLEEEWNEGRYEELRKEVEELRERRAKLEGILANVRRQKETLREDMERCRKSEDRLKRLESEERRIREKLRFVKDMREIFKRAIPEITRAYVEAVSVEANRIFCEIMGDYNWELRWTEDFGIKAKYMGRDIDFSQMSGGEQVCAALAVRLALLKVLSNMRVVFFDEPTQNMDETRRRNFATQLSKIEGFKQIFVISHDDTFEEMVENAIKIKKENGISVVV